MATAEVEKVAAERDRQAGELYASQGVFPPVGGVVLDEFFTCPHVAMGFAQGAVRRALEANGVTIKFKEGTDPGSYLLYMVDGKAVSEYNASTGTMIHRLDSSKQQERLMNAHASLYADFRRK